jgi:hypothetical protein
MSVENNLITSVEKALSKITVLQVHLKKKGNRTKYILDIFRRRKSLTDLSKQLRGIDEERPPLN